MNVIIGPFSFWTFSPCIKFATATHPQWHYLNYCNDFPILHFRFNPLKVSLRKHPFLLALRRWGVSSGGTSATQQQKFHTDDIKSVRNPVRSADWSTEQLHRFSWVAETDVFAGYLNVEGRFVGPKYRETASRFCPCCFGIIICILVLDKTARFGCITIIVFCCKNVECAVLYSAFSKWTLEISYQTELWISLESWP